MDRVVQLSCESTYQVRYPEKTIPNPDITTMATSRRSLPEANREAPRRKARRYISIP